MKPRNRQHRSLKVPSSRWMAYAVAGLATASGSAISTEGAIHYSGPIDFRFHNQFGFKKHSFPLSQGAVLVGYRVARGGGGDSSATFSIRGAAVSNALGLYPPFFSSVAKPLPRGAVISQGYFRSRYGGLGRLQDYSCYFPGWQDPGTHAIGFRFNSGAGMQYGWVRIKFAGCGAGDNKYIVKDYAWGDPGDQIKAGQTQLHEDEAQVVPQAAKKPDAAPLANSQGSLGLLALGAVGLQAWRKSRLGRVSSDAR